MALRAQLSSIGLAFVLVVGTGTLGVAHEKDHAHEKSRIHQVVMLDDCDAVTFNEAFGPGICLNVAGGARGSCSRLSRCAARRPSPVVILSCSSSSGSNAGIRCARSIKAGKSIPLLRWRSSGVGSFLG